MGVRITAAAIVLLCGVVAGAEPAAPRNEATFEALVAATREPDRAIRALAAWSLGRTGRADAVPALRALATGDAGPGVRASALRALAALLPEKSRVDVKMAMPEPDEDLRLAALVAAGSLRFEQRDAMLKAALENGTSAEQALAVQALRLDDPAHSRPLLRHVAEQADAFVRAAALRELGQIANAEDTALISTALQERTIPNAFALREAACQTWPKQAPAMPLRQATEDPHSLVRRAAVVALAERTSTESAPAFLARLSDADFTVRAAACDALGRITPAQAAAPLAAGLADEMTVVRDAAEAALMRWPPETGHVPLPAFARQRENTDLRQRAWRLLGHYAHPDTLGLAVAHLTDDDPYAAAGSLAILRKNKDARAVPRAIELLKFATNRALPPEPLVLEAYRTAVDFRLSEPASSAVLVITTFNKSQSPTYQPTDFAPSLETVAAAAGYLGEIGHQPAVPALRAAFAATTGSGPLAAPFSVALKRLTGQDFPLAAPEPAPAPAPGDYFITVHPEGA